MQEPLLCFGAEQFNRLFPIYLMLDGEGKLMAAGTSLQTLQPDLLHQSFFDLFDLQRPNVQEKTMSALLGTQGQLVVMQTKGENPLVLRGQWENIAEKGQLLFVGSPWFASMEEVMERDLSLHHFALHDPLIDLLHVVKSQEITYQDLKELLQRMKEQKAALGSANAALEKQKAFFEGVLNNMPADIAVFSPTHEYLYVNPRGIKDPALRQWMIGKRDEDYCRLRNKPMSIATDRRAIFNEVIKNKTHKEWEESFVDATGKASHLLRRWYPVQNNAGEIELVIGYGLDISERKNMEKELVKARERAEELAMTKENFLANMSHEIRTPMNAILGMGNQLVKTNLTAQQQFYLKTINTAAENLLVIINDILDLSKIEAGKLSVESMAFEPNKVLQNVLLVMDHKAAEKGLLLRLAPQDARLSPVLMGDHYRLNQVFLNLISNAIKFTGRGRVELGFDVLEDQDQQQWIEGWVSDTGKGMDQEFVTTLFDKFTQEYESGTRKYEGTGLGMSICKELVELMGGTIGVHSEKGIGTRVFFRIALPKGQAKDLPKDKYDKVLNQGFLKGKNILLVDDNDMNRLVATTILTDQGAVVLEAENGEAALSKVQSQSFDLVLMDIQMPVMNGFEATRLLRQQGFLPPIIALTANAIKGESNKCLAAGMNDFIPKPFQEEQFLHTLSKWVPVDPAEKEKTTLKENPGAPTPTATTAAEAPLYDLSYLTEIGRGSQQFMGKMIGLFCEQTPQTIAEMKTAFAQDDFGHLGGLAHKMKPSIDTLFISRLKPVIRAIEKAGKEKRKSPELVEQIELLETTLTEVVSQLQRR